MSAVWKSVRAKFVEAADSVAELGSVDTLKFVAACEEIANVYDALFGGGILAGQLKGDILNSAGTVRKVFLKQPDKCATLKGMVEYELSTRGRDKVRADKTSGVVGMLWAKRATQFIMVFLELLGTRPDLTGPQCARETYARVLSRYHGWLTSGAVSTAMGLAPSRENILAKLELKGAEAEPEIASVVVVVRGLVDEVQRLLDANDVDFPDKV